MGDIKIDELEFLVELLEKYPLDSLRSIAKREGLEYYKLKRIYDRYYGKYLTVSAIYNIRRIGLKSFVAFLAVSPEDLLETAVKMTSNPFVKYVNPAFGFKNGLSAYLQVPYDQTELIEEMLSRYSDDFEYYEVRAYRKRKMPEEWGKWDLSYDYAILMDVLKWDARTPVKRIAEIIGKSRTTIRYMINRLKEKGIISAFVPLPDMNVEDRGVIGITRELNEEVLERFKKYEITVGVLPGTGYLLEWLFSSREDMGAKILEFSKYVDKILIEYFDPTFKELNDKNSRTAFQRMVKKDGSGYRSILEF
ncbi:Lrp/AsnC family transcriptional regulator [Thermococcus sp.]